MTAPRSAAEIMSKRQRLLELKILTPLEEELLSALEAREQEVKELQVRVSLAEEAADQWSDLCRRLREKARAAVEWSEGKDACRPRSRCRGRRVVMDDLKAELPPEEAQP